MARKINRKGSQNSVELPAPPKAAVLPRKSVELKFTKMLEGSSVPVPVTGKIRLDIAAATATVLLTMTDMIRTGMTGNVYYEALVDTLAALTASYNGQKTLADLIASLEHQLKTARLAQQAETVNARNVLRQAASDCMAYDKTDEALASVGWQLQKGRTPAAPLPAPVKLDVRTTTFPGVMNFRWGRVPNARFYEVQAATAGNGSAPEWDNVPAVVTSLASLQLPEAPLGQMMYARVRSSGSKGRSPWSTVAANVVL